MRRPTRFGLVVLGLLLTPFLVFSGCQPAARYNPELPSGLSSLPKGPEPIQPDYAWMPPSLSPKDIPILFIDATNSEDWTKLEKFWNWVPPLGTGQPMILLGQSPLGALSALVLTSPVIKIKVPLGLPNPTKYIPAANPPTLLKWSLGRKLFFDKSLLGRDLACADCHNPKEGFTENRGALGEMKAPSLINCVYNKTQFWDGRVTYLEEVVQRSLEDERPGVKSGVEDDKRHAWKGIVGRLRGKGKYVDLFLTAFETDPTQDNVAKALATYLRTILSGNSLHDKADRERQGKELEAKHYEKFLDDKTVKTLEPTPLTPGEASRLIFQGYQLFHGKARCHLCHPAPLYTNHDFHNVGVEESSKSPATSGRIVQVPIGVKEQRLEGAFKTPTLRHLPRTYPYMHDGSLPNLAAVVRYFNTGLGGHLHLDPLLQMPGVADRGRNLQLSPEEVRALALFLKALDGESVDPLIAAEP
jgi:cytochrome c peroxidase